MNAVKSNTEDVEPARSLLEEEGWNLVIVREGQVLFSSRERGIAPFFQAVQSMGKSLHNAAMADRIVGLAVAMLCLHTRITSVYASIASQGALDMLKVRGVTVNSQNIVPHISNYNVTGLCPFEKLAGSLPRLSQSFSVIQSLFVEGDR